MASEMVERVIASQVDYVSFQGSSRGWYLCTKDVEQVEDREVVAGPFETRHEAEQAGQQLNARAAIAAMRSPTEAMIRSCGNGECSKWAPGAWQNYIDAALAEDARDG